MLSQNKILTIEEIAQIIKPIAQSYGVGSVALFGSYARGEATFGSDIDLRIVDDGALRGFVRLAGFHRELEESLHTNVDVIPTDALSESFLNEIRAEEVMVYAS
ncbi:MAG: nucleotidyltransferase domain-containing protein [Dehalococcoidia bacterium]|nr:nucleotidyltransferase domain-containing protein [Dehalococcoidia bacterium]